MTFDGGRESERQQREAEVWLERAADQLARGQAEAAVAAAGKR